MESTLLKFNDDTKLGIFENSLEDRIRNQNYVDKVKKLFKNGKDQFEYQEEQFSRLILVLIDMLMSIKTWSFKTSNV